MDNKAHEYILPNGFKILVKEDHRAPIAIFQICYKVGSSYEHNGITGISHVLEHMMFTGTRKYSSNFFLKTIAEYGGHLNAQTGHDFTAYHEIIHTDYIEKSFLFEADRMCNLLLNKKAFLKEMQVIMEERRTTVNDKPERLLLEYFYQSAYLSSPYRYPIIGYMDDLKNMTLKDIRSWYTTWYAPNNAIGIIIGDVDPAHMLVLAKKYFGKIKPSVVPVVKPQKEIASLGIRTQSIKIPAKLPWLVIGFNTPALNTAEKTWEAYALWLLCEILAGSSSTRLSTKLLRKKQIILDANYSYTPYSRIDNVLTLMVTPTDINKIDEVRDGVFNEIKQLQSEPPSLKELNRVKIQLTAQRTYQKDSIAAQALEIATFEAGGLSWHEIENAYKHIANITPKQIQKIAKKYLIEDNLTMATLMPSEQVSNTLKPKNQG